MKSNLKIIILSFIIIITLLTKTFSNEPFNFDISKIEITDNGNKFKGLQRGMATSISGLIIEADKFEYNKLTNILNAYGNVIINDQQNDYIIYANDVTYLQNIEKIYSNGITKALIESKFDFLSKNVTLLRNDQEFFSSEFTIVKDDKLTEYTLDEFRYFIEDSFLKGKNIQVKSDYTKYPEERDDLKYKDGIFNLKTKDYHASDTKVFLKENTFGIYEGSIQSNFKKKDEFALNNNNPRLYGV